MIVLVVVVVVVILLYRVVENFLMKKVLRKVMDITGEWWRANRVKGGKVMYLVVIWTTKRYELSFTSFAALLRF